jgi:hypothetical protein
VRANGRSTTSLISDVFWIRALCGISARQVVVPDARTGKCDDLDVTEQLTSWRPRHRPTSDGGAGAGELLGDEVTDIRVAAGD